MKSHHHHYPQLPRHQQEAQHLLALSQTHVVCQYPRHRAYDSSTKPYKVTLFHAYITP
jgi:hypothetical protein